MATTIDALGLAEDFEKAGFSRDQAFGMARAIRDHSHATLATKTDLHELELRLDARFEQIETRFAQVDGRFEQMKQRFVWLEEKWDERLQNVKIELKEEIAHTQVGLIKWFTGMLVAQAAAIVALIKLLPGAAS